MALRLAGGMPPMPPMEEEIPMEEPMDMGVPAMDFMAQNTAPAPAAMPGGGMISPDVVKYMSSDMRCMNCVHYMEAGQTGSCEIVSGPIDPQGVCLIFSADTEPQLTEEPVPGPMEGDIPMDVTDNTGAEGA
jgi:hypothetical protein